MTEAPFDLCGPLPEGVVVLEASAGTGKTYAIAALVARHVADGTPLDELLVVTFTRMATGELRERVRERLVAVAEGLEAALDGEAAPADRVTAGLASGGRDVVQARRDRLRRALADFDAATIATTHGFCQEALAGLGVAADIDLDAVFVEDIGDLVEEVVDDLYLLRFAREGAPRIGRAQAGQIARKVVENPLAPLEPGADDPRETPAMRRRLADAVRDELEVRKRRLAVLTYDDLLTRLDGTLRAGDGDQAVARLRDRFRIVLIDEFQDTDPVQWDIIERAFVHDGGTLVLIGDPKQAVYAFRGADVYAYLRAARSAPVTQTLGVNWRSDQVYVDACDKLFAGAALGEEGIVHRAVRAAPPHQGRRLHGAPHPAPLRIRVLDRTDVPCTRNGLPLVPGARAHIAADLAADVVQLLASDAEIEQRAPDGTPTGRAPVRPGDLAVLVRTNAGAALARDALDAAGVPAVIAGAGSVFETGAALDWLRLLEALERPSAVGGAHLAALTPFLGWGAERVATADDDEWEVVHGRLHRWARVLRERGVAALMEAVTLTGRMPGRLLAQEDGERRLTDLRHLAQLLHEAASADALGVTALASWLRKRIAEAWREGDEERSRRLESDAEAVQILTVHRAKGLEFPIVYLPSLWDPVWRPDEAAPVAFHDPAADDVRTIDVGLEGPGYLAHKDQAVTEERGEDLRLAYVALTRARHQAVVWWAGSRDSKDSALSRLVFDRTADGRIPAKGRRVPTDLQAREAFANLADPDVIAVEAAKPWVGARFTPPPGPATTLAVARFDRTLDHGWRRTSFSDLTAGTYEARVASEPEDPVLSDEPDGPSGAAAAPAGDEALRAAPAAFTAMPMGTQVGTAVHGILEAVDFAAADLDAELVTQLDRVPGTDVLGDRAAVVAGLRGVLETPLGPLVGGARLRDVTRGDRLDELSFELPLLGGEEPTGRLDLTDLGELLRATLPSGDPLAAYADRLADPALRRGVRGYLTGSIDLVLRIGGRFVVADYKTNWLAPPAEALTAWHHRPEALAREMLHHHYALQGLLYTAALHRYLRWRLPGYDPATHLGGVLYLFLRGMTGPDTPAVDGVPCGVFAWQPPPSLVTGLSDLLDRG